MLDHELPGVGAIIYYKVRPSDLPINADREWKGKVIKVHPKNILCYSVVRSRVIRGWIQRGNRTRDAFSNPGGYT
jgi:hypothetical protein